MIVYYYRRIIESFGFPLGEGNESLSPRERD
jgi:hypothetical protein